MNAAKWPTLLVGICTDTRTCIAGTACCVLAYFVLQRTSLAWLSPVSSMLALVLWLWPTLIILNLRRVGSKELSDRAKHAAVVEERDMLRTLVDSLPDFIYVKDAHGRFLLANRFCCEAMGTTSGELIGRSDFDYYPREIAQNFHEDERQIVLTGQPMLYRQEEVVDGMGRVSTILTTKVPLRDAKNDIVGIMGIGRNITARVDAERKLLAAQQAVQAEMRERERMAIELRLAQKLESVGRLAAGLAHEINTPIQYVGDSVHFLKSAFEDLSKLFVAYREAATRNDCSAADSTGLRDLEAAIDFDFLSLEVPRAFERTLEGTDRVAHIVRAMKEFAHPDTNEHKPADLNRALSTTLTVARSEYRYAANVSTVFGDIPEVVCSLGELNQVFLNLIVNSAHAIIDSGQDATTGVIQIQTRQVGEEVQVVIGDNGCGIAPENLEKVFDPFFTTKEVGRGTGQGLAIARSIVVDKHGGRIDVKSKVGCGTEFIISLPIAGRIKAAA